MLNPINRELASVEGVDGFPIFELDSPCKLRVIVTMSNIGPASANVLFNFRVPTQIELQPVNDPRTGHYVSADERLLESAYDGMVQTRYSVAETVLPKRVSITYAAEVTIPHGGCPWPNGWPMRAMARGLHQEEAGLDHPFWIRMTMPSKSLTAAPSAATTGRV